MLYNIQVKADNQKAWRKLSVKMRSIEALKRDIEQYIIMYAEQKQLNYHTIAARIVDDSNTVIYVRESNATANKGV